MEKISRISGAKVTCAENGKTVGSVETVICTGDTKVLGFLLQSGKIGNRYGFVCVEDILTIQNGEVCIFNEASVQREKKLLQKYRKQGGWNWLNKKAVTPKGELLGTISDGLFEFQNGKISQIELSLGVMEDLRDGRRRYFINEDTEFTKEFLVLKDGGGHDE